MGYRSLSAANGDAVTLGLGVSVCRLRGVTSRFLAGEHPPPTPSQGPS